jgi:hypothetical protein
VKENQIYYVSDIYDKPECAPFTRRYTLHQYTKDTLQYYMMDAKDCFLYCANTKKLKTIKKSKCQFEEEHTKQIGTITSTYAYYSPDIDPSDLPCGKAQIYRKGRHYGSWTKNGSKNNGSKNYNLARVDIESKDLAKKLGLTYNKKMLEDFTSEETSAFNSFIKESMDGFNADTGNKGEHIALYRIAIKHGIRVDVGKLPTSLRPPSPQPAPVPVPVPQPVPTPAPVPQPTPVPVPVPTPAPASIPDPDPDPVPQPVPDPEPTPDPIPAPAPEPDPVPTVPEPAPSPVPLAVAVPVNVPVAVHIPVPARVHVPQSIDPGLTDEQLAELLRRDKQLLKNHPAMIRAYHEIITRNT